MNKQELRWKRLGNRTILNQNRLHLVEYDIVLPNGEKSTYLLQHANGAVATLIEYKKETLLLTYQYRFPLDKWIYDLPGGEVHEGEDPAIAAVRECEEEIGVKPKNSQHLVSFYPNPSKTDWPVHIYFCSEFEKRKPIQTEASETVHKVLITKRELEKKIYASEIVDPSLIIAWYTALSKKLL